MPIYKLKSDDDNYWACFIDAAEIAVKIGEDFDMAHDGKSKLNWWKSIDISFYESENYTHTNISIPDIDMWESYLVLNQRAYKALSPKLEKFGEFLHLNCEGKPYYFFNTLKEIRDSAIDLDNSEKIIDSGVYMGLEKFKFHEDKIDNDELIFRTSYDSFIDIYCNEKLKNIIKNSGLTGLNFEEDLAKY